MDKIKIIETLVDVESQTKVKAWMFQIENKCYQIATYSAYRIGDNTAIWACNKKGKRGAGDPLFKIHGIDHKKCLERYLDYLEEKEIEDSILAEETK